MSKIYLVNLSDDEKVYLHGIVKKRLSTSEAVKRSNILLAADHLGALKWADARIAAEYKVSKQTIERLQERFIEGGVSPHYQVVHVPRVYERPYDTTKPVVNYDESPS